MLRAVESPKSISPASAAAAAACHDACSRARRAQEAFAATSTRARAALLRQLRAALLRRAEELIAIVVDESKKVRFEAITLEIVPAALALTYNAHIAERAGERLLPCILELGGNAPAIVTAGADLDRASRAIVYGGLANAGQSCVAVERVFAVPAVFDELMARTSSLAARISPGVDVAAMNPVQRAKVAAWRTQALDRGAVFHGDVIDMTNADGADGASDAGALDGGEVFGPVIPFHRVHDVNEAVARANAAPQQLCAYVFGGRHEARELRALAQRLRAPHVVINDVMVSYAMMELPFFGHAASGMGRVHGEDGLRALCREQIVVDGHLPTGKEPWWLPYEDGVGELLLKGLERALSLRDRVPF